MNCHLFFSRQKTFKAISNGDKGGRLVWSTFRHYKEKLWTNEIVVWKRYCLQPLLVSQFELILTIADRGKHSRKKYCPTSLQNVLEWNEVLWRLESRRCRGERYLAERLRSILISKKRGWDGFKILRYMRSKHICCTIWHFFKLFIHIHVFIITVN